MLEGEDYDITPEQSDNESECGVSDFGDEVSPCANVGQTTWTELQTEDEEDEDEDEDEEEDVSPLGIVFQLIEDEELSKNCSTTIEEEHVWMGMTVLKTVADSERSELLDDGEGLPVYFEDSEDEVEAKLDLVSPSKPMALYSLYKMASDGHSDTQQRRARAIEEEERQGWSDMAALAQVALHHHSQYENLANEPKRGPVPPSSDEALRAPSAARRAQMHLRARPPGGNPLHHPMPPSEPQSHPAATRRSCDEDVWALPGATTSSNAATSASSSSSSSSSSSCQPVVCSGPSVPANPVQRLRGLSSKGLLRVARDSANEREVLDLLGMDQNERHLARVHRDRQIEARLQEQSNKAQECEKIFREVMQNLRGAPPAVQRGARSAEKGQFILVPKGGSAPPLRPRLRSTLNNTLRRSDGSGATLKGQKVKLCPLKSGVSKNMNGTFTDACAELDREL